MSLLLLIDGYNVVAPLGPPSRSPDARWLQRERMRLIHRLTRHLADEVRKRTCVVFDAANPPPDRPSQFEIEGMDIRFAVEYLEADELIEELIAAHSAPKRLAVVSSDQRIQVAAQRRGSVAFHSQVWLDDLLDGVVRLAVPIQRRAGQGRSAGQGRGAGQGSHKATDDKPAPSVEEDDVDKWMREFGF